MSDSTKALLDEKGIILGVGKAAIDAVRNLNPIDLGTGGEGVLKKGKDVVKDGVGKVFDLFGNRIEEKGVESPKNEDSSTESGTGATDPGR